MHNHPSGDLKPSRDDIEMTREIRRRPRRWALPSTITW
jgi:DNA repair protein RadC